MVRCAKGVDSCKQPEDVRSSARNVRHVLATIREASRWLDCNQNYDATRLHPGELGVTGLETEQHAEHAQASWWEQQPAQEANLSSERTLAMKKGYEVSTF